MNEPIRLRELGGEGTQLLRVARRPRALPSEVRARTAAKVAAIAATPVAVGAAAKWLTGKTLAWLLGFGVLGAAIGIGAYAMRGGQTGVVIEEPQISHAAPPVTIAIPDQPAPPKVETTPPAATAKPTTAPKASVDTLAEENALLDPVRGNADPATALAATDAHKKKFPNGQLAADREYLAIRALKKLGRDDDAKARGDAFLTRFPQSPYAMYVRKLIQ
jgi:hypothetical protein